MKSYKQWKEQVFQTPEEIHHALNQAINRLSHFGSKEVAEFKGELLELRKMLDDKLSGV